MTNKSQFFALIAFVTCAMLLLFGMFMLYPQLPLQVPAHYDVNGHPTRFDDRSSFTWTILGTGMGIPLFLVVLMFCIRFLPPRFLNVPHADYWRAPENHARACDYLFTSSLWFGTALLVWANLFWRTLVAAALKNPPHLDGNGMGWLMAGFGTVTVIWVIALLRRFNKRK